MSNDEKLTRSKTVSVRFDPKLHYMAQLAARQQRRTLSSFIEWTIQQALKSQAPKEEVTDGR